MGSPCAATESSPHSLQLEESPCKATKTQRRQKYINKILKKGEKKKKKLMRDFPDGPVVKTLPFNARGMGLIPGRGSRSNVVTSSIKIF